MNHHRSDTRQVVSAKSSIMVLRCVLALLSTLALGACASAAPQSVSAPSSAAFQSEAATSAPFAVADEAVYPPATPIAAGVVLPATAACPNTQGLAPAPEPPSAQTIADLLTSLGAADLATRRQAADAAFWPLLDTMPTTKDAVAQDQIAPAQPARAAPSAQLLANACGDVVLQASWWAPICPGPCAAADVQKAASLTDNVYLIQRDGRWLVWASE